MFDLDVSEFLNNIIEKITTYLLEIMRVNCIKMYTNIFSQANTATENAANQLIVTPQDIFPNVYTTIQEISKTVFIPIAGIILACILCYECVNMLAESNRMREFGPQDIYILIFKMVIGIILLTHSFEIINWAFEVGQWAVRKTGMVASNSNIGEGFDAISYIEESDDLFAMIGYLLIGVGVKILIMIFSVAIRVAVWVRFVELYMFIVSSSIPFATFLNKEWGQIGYNYVRKILSLAFQPVYMIICFAIFQGTLIIQSDSGFAGALLKSAGAMFLLILALFKTRTISDSIFNAH